MSVRLSIWLTASRQRWFSTGNWSPEACRSVGLSAADVALKLRSQGIFQLKQVKRAVIEQNGQLIIVQAGEENPKYPLITDGVVQIDILESIDKTEEWLVERLAKDGYTDISNIFIAEYESGNLNVVTYWENLAKRKPFQKWNGFCFIQMDFARFQVMQSFVED